MPRKSKRFINEKEKEEVNDEELPILRALQCYLYEAFRIARHLYEVKKATAHRRGYRRQDQAPDGRRSAEQRVLDDNVSLIELLAVLLCFTK
jgi:hypothetical protein